MKTSLILLFILGQILLLNNLNGQVSEKQLDSSLQIIKRDILRIDSLIASQKIELDKAQNIIELQNKQLEQANDLISLYFTLIGISLAVVGIVIYFQFIRPIDQQKKEVENLNAQSKKILADINGTLREVVEENYARYQDERLKKVLNLFYKDNQASNIALQVLNELNNVGFSESQLLIIKDYFFNIQNKELGQRNNAQINRCIWIMIDYLISVGRLNWVQEIFESYFSPNIKGSAAVYFSMYYKYAEFLSKNMMVEDYNKVIKMVTNIHPFYEDILKQRTDVFNTWLYKIVHFQPMIAAQILDDKYFVNEIARLGILDEIIKKHSSEEQKQEDFGTRTKEIGNTYFLIKLNEINDRFNKQGIENTQ